MNKDSASASFKIEYEIFHRKKKEVFFFEKCVIEKENEKKLNI